MAQAWHVGSRESSLFPLPRLLSGDYFFKNSSRDPDDGEEDSKPPVRQLDLL